MSSEETSSPAPVEPIDKARAEESDSPSSETTAEASSTSNAMVFRETVESLAVAFILALLFKAFIAEAFIIPTGSMAPTLMGAHKDVACASCSFRYQTGASSEFNDLGQSVQNHAVVGTICPLCRRPQVADPNLDANQATFSGDRILVSKLAYVWNRPERWDVIVFKYIENARQNYIKRCIGLPNETIRIQGGDIFVRDNGSDNQKFEIARKPPHVANAMLQDVNDTQHIPHELVDAGMPSYWQTEDEEDQRWTVDWSVQSWQAQCQNQESDTSWLRYYHRVVDLASWNALLESGNLPVALQPRQPRIITDFTAYNASITASITTKAPNYAEIANRAVHQWLPGDSNFNVRFQGNDGIHYTGDLAGEFDIETAPGSTILSLLIVEQGARHIVDIDLETGIATARVEFEGKPLDLIEDGESFGSQATARTSVRAGGKHRIKFSNVDDQLLLWVDGHVSDWSPSNRLHWEHLKDQRPAGPMNTETDPLDGAPIGIGIASGTLTVTRARVSRDIYYIAHGKSGGSALHDYSHPSESLRNSLSSLDRQEHITKTYGDQAFSLIPRVSEEVRDRDTLAQLASQWGTSPMTLARRSYDFSMENDWYFPLGDNSSSSSDARSWNDHHTPGRLMIGRAVVVFWPHFWNAPIPFTPNIQRMGLIR